MTPFALKIVTPDGLVYDGQAEELIVRTTSGDMGVLAGHMDCVAPLGMGQATIVTEGKRRYGACIGGMLSVMDGNVTLVATTFEWAEDIDIERADASYDRAKTILDDRGSTDTEVRLAEARLKRALVRKGVASRK
jgi:F-type H+-transporting ATPase subunit epsilon